MKAHPEIPKFAVGACVCDVCVNVCIFTYISNNRTKLGSDDELPWPSLEPGTPSTPDIAFPDARRARHAMLSESTETQADAQGPPVQTEEQEAASEEKQLVQDEKEDAEAGQTQEQPAAENAPQPENNQEQQPVAAEPAPEVCMHTYVDMCVYVCVCLVSLFFIYGARLIYSCVLAHGCFVCVLCRKKLPVYLHTRVFSIFFASIHACMHACSV